MNVPAHLSLGGQGPEANALVVTGAGQHEVTLSRRRGARWGPLGKGQLFDRMLMRLDHVRQLRVPCRRGCAPQIDRAFARARRHILAVGTKGDRIDEPKRFGEDTVNERGPGKISLRQVDPAQVKLPQVEARKIIAAQVHAQL